MLPLLNLRLIGRFPRLAVGILSIWEPIDTKRLNKYARVVVNAATTVLVVYLIERLPVVCEGIIAYQVGKVIVSSVQAFRRQRTWNKIKERYDA